jgi:hypothetical protein
MVTYTVTWVPDDTDALEQALNSIVAEDAAARVVSVSWQPARENPQGGPPIPAGYTCVSEHPDA